MLRIVPAPIPPPGRTLTSAGLGLAGCILLGMIGCQRSDQATTEAGPPELPVIEAEVLTVQLESWPETVRSYGSLVADETAVVGSRLEGRVDQVFVDLGDVVREGAPLVTLSQAQFQLRVEQAEAQLQQARSAVGLREEQAVAELNPENSPPVLEQKALWKEAQANVERAQQLRERNSITVADFEQIAATASVTEARYRSALNSVREKIALIGVREAELSLAREELKDTVIRVPFDGLVQQKHVSPGSYVQSGDSCVTVVRTDRLRFRGTIPERHALQLSVGQSVELRVESIPEPFTVPVSRISPALDLLSRSLLFEATVENESGKFRSGLFAEATIETDRSARAIVIPESALIEFAGAEKVWKVVAGKTQEQPVLTGGRREQSIEILDGVQPGDVILLHAEQGRPGIVRSPQTDQGSPDDQPVMSSAPLEESGGTANASISGSESGSASHTSE